MIGWIRWKLAQRRARKLRAQLDAEPPPERVIAQVCVLCGHPHLDHWNGKCFVCGCERFVGPCPRCGSRRVWQEWIDIGTAEGKAQLVPGSLHCEDCERRFTA